MPYAQNLSQVRLFIFLSETKTFTSEVGHYLLPKEKPFKVLEPIQNDKMRQSHILHVTE